MKRIIGVWVLVGLGFSSAVSAQESRGWLDVDFVSAIPAEKEYTATLTYTKFQEPAASSVAYSFPTGKGFGFGAGYMVASRIGVGFNVGRNASQDIAGLGISIPHPIFNNRSAADGATTDEDLKRVERAVHLQGMLVVADSPTFRVRAFGGPTSFHVRQDTVNDIPYSQLFTLLGGNAVAITGYDSEKSDASAWGFNVGADATYFVAPQIGVGGFVRFSRATANLPDLNRSIISSITVGGTQVGVGLRVKF